MKKQKKGQLFIIKAVSISFLLACLLLGISSFFLMGVTFETVQLVISMMLISLVSMNTYLIFRFAKEKRCDADEW